MVPIYASIGRNLTFIGRNIRERESRIRGIKYVTWSTSSEVYASGALGGPAQDSPDPTTLITSDNINWIQEYETHRSTRRCKALLCRERKFRWLFLKTYSPTAERDCVSSHGAAKLHVMYWATNKEDKLIVRYFINLYNHKMSKITPWRC